MPVRPYYEQDGIAIYHGDTLAVLHGLSCEVQAFVTDPPYASGTRKEAGKPSSGAMLRGERWAEKPIENDQMTTTGFVWLMREVAYEARRMLIDGGSLLAFIDWRQWPTLVGAVESTNLRVNGMVVWDKGSYGLGHGFRSQHELVCHASKGVARICDRSTGNVLRAKRVTADEHPSPKPPDLMRALLAVVTEPGDLVVDPFMGSGATVVAAHASGRRAIGIEIEERYCEIAARRLSQGVLALETPA